MRDAFRTLPDAVRAAVLHGEGEHFCAGLDLCELQERDASAGLHHSRTWHAALEELQYGQVPVVAALHGAVIGGGLEIASACHIRVADETTFYALPEGSRGIVVGGGGAVRIPRLIGAARMTDMMLTGRVYNADEGERAGFAQYLVPVGQAYQRGLELANRVAQNAPLTNYALMHAGPNRLIAHLPGQNVSPTNPPLGTSTAAIWRGWVRLVLMSTGAADEGWAKFRESRAAPDAGTTRRQ